MKVVVQRSLNAKCIINNQINGEIDKGYVLLVGFTNGDNEETLIKMVKKIVNLRIFRDDNDKMNLSIKDVNGSILSISQFTLYGDARKGNRPSFIEAAKPELASVLYDNFNEKLRKENIKVETGIFGADMKILFTNDGPVTILLDSENR